MESHSLSPAIFHIHNRTLILVLAPLIAVFCFTRILDNRISGELWLNWLAGLVLWAFLLFLALRRRLVLTQDWLEYTESFTTIRVPWAQVSRLNTRRALGIWSIEGLEVWTASPKLKEHFIDLTQFSKSWRQEALGSALRKSAPHLFQDSAHTHRAA